jgi:hypothetical protein
MFTADTAFQASDFRARIRKSSRQKPRPEPVAATCPARDTLRLSVKQTPVSGSTSGTSSGLVIGGDISEDGSFVAPNFMWDGARRFRILSFCNWGASCHLGSRCAYVKWFERSLRITASGRFRPYFHSNGDGRDPDRVLPV